MPGQRLFQPNPPPDRSLLPESVLDFNVSLDTKNALSREELTAIKQFRRAADYIAAGESPHCSCLFNLSDCMRIYVAMIFLKDNALVERDIIPDDIKPRLLGHWGTCPGLTLVYAHLNRLISKTGVDTLYVVGPGHGAPAILASLWLENSLANFYLKYSRDRDGLFALISSFSSPGGFPRYVVSSSIFFSTQG